MKKEIKHFGYHFRRCLKCRARNDGVICEHCQLKHKEFNSMVTLPERIKVSKRQKELKPVAQSLHDHVKRILKLETKLVEGVEDINTLLLLHRIALKDYLKARRVYLAPYGLLRAEGIDVS